MSNNAIGPVSLRHPGGRGLPLVMIHGYGADRLTFTANQPALSTVADVYMLELPGHGESGPAVGDGTVTTLAHAVAARLKEAGIGPALLVGHSLGGALSVRLAALYPDLVRALVAISPVGLGGDIDSAFLNMLPELDNPEDAEWLLKRLVARPRLVNRMMVAYVLEQLDVPGRRDALRRIAAGMRGIIGEMAPAYAAVQASGLPRLVIWGAEDHINRLETDKLEAFGGERLILAETGHIPHAEAAPQVNRALTTFVTSLEA